jgi:hypothetical protein
MKHMKLDPACNKIPYNRKCYNNENANNEISE